MRGQIRNPILSAKIFQAYLIALLLVLFSPPRLLYGADPEPVGTVLAISGTIEYRVVTPEAKDKSGKVVPASFSPWQKAEFKQPVFANYEFRTAQRSRLKIKFSDNSLIALGPNSQMQIESYLFSAEDKLRQGAINIAQGLSMYIFNKSQTHKDSQFKIVSPAGNIAARGTHGYVAVTGDQMLVANRAGSVAAFNEFGSVNCGRMEKTIIPRGQPPLPPQKLTFQEARAIQNLVMGRIGPGATGQRDEKPMISVEEKEKKEEKEDDKKEGKKSDSPKDSSKEQQADKKDSDKKETGKDSKDPAKGSSDSKSAEAGGSKTGSSPGSDSSSTSGGGKSAGGFQARGGDFGTSFGGTGPGGGASGDTGGPKMNIGADSFMGGFDLGPDFGSKADFSPVNQPFQASMTTACAK